MADPFPLQALATIVGAFITGGVAAWVGLTITRKKKQVTFWVEAVEDLTTPLRKERVKAKIVVADQEVETLCRSVVQVVNTGNVAIPAFSFELMLPNAIRILSTVVATADPYLSDDIKPDRSSDDKRVTFAAKFLNPREVVRTTIYFDGPSREPDMACRMEDVEVRFRTGSFASKTELVTELAYAVAKNAAFRFSPAANLTTSRRSGGARGPRGRRGDPRELRPRALLTG